MGEVSKFLVLSGVVFILTDWVKGAIPAKLPPFWIQALAFAVAIVAVFLVGASVWSKEQVVGGHVLSDLNGWDKVLVGIVIGAGGSLADRLKFFTSRVSTGESTVVSTTASPEVAAPVQYEA